MENNIIYGKTTVKNAITGTRKPKVIYLNNNKSDEEILSLARTNNIKVQLVSVDQLERLTGNKNHQGVACQLPEFQYKELEDLLFLTKDKTDSTIVMLDGVEDPVNFGSIIRSSGAFDVDGIIIGKNRQVPVTGTVSKIATGAEEIVPIVQVTNLTQSIEKLKKNGYWIVTSAGEGKDVYDRIDYRGKIVLVIGNEGFGVSRLVREHSDFIASIPLEGKIKALNASIATAVFLAEINSCRRKKKS